jgi:hypothetical protein
MKKICRICHIEKDTENGDFQIRKTPAGVLYFRTECKDCRSQNSKIYYEENSEKIISQSIRNKKINRIHINNQIRERKLTDISFKMSSNIRSLIKISIKRNGGSKNGNSCLKYLSYSLNELKNHLEKQFESWMTWDNWGIYDKNTWDDSNTSTWRWQLDHIIPQSDLPYKTMDDENFKKCWSLDNLRPYSAKLNVIEGSARARHKKAA